MAGEEDDLARLISESRSLAIPRGMLLGFGIQGAASLKPPVKDKPECTCVHDCAGETRCSLSGQWHVHPDSPQWPGLYGPCPIHPDAPGDH